MMLDTNPELLRKLAEAVERYNAMTPGERAAHDYEQRRSFVRGSCPSKQDYAEWCKIVDRVLPPMDKR